MIFFFRAIRSPSSSHAPRRGGAALLTFGAFKNFRRNPLYNPAEFPIIIQKLRVIELFLDASTFGGIQLALKLQNFLLQGSVFSSCVCKGDLLSILKDIKKDMDEKEPTSPPVQMEFLKKLMGAIQKLSLPKNPPSPEKAVDWTISQLAKQITMSAETRKAYKRAFMMSLHDNGKAQGKK